MTPAKVYDRPLSFGRAKERYVHRFTAEHVPDWASKPLNLNGGRKYPAPQYTTDREWYEKTRFPGEGEVHKRARYCHSSNPSWPFGKMLDEPFAKGRTHNRHAAE